jgi:hypothetical protein
LCIASFLYKIYQLVLSYVPIKIILFCDHSAREIIEKGWQCTANILTPIQKYILFWYARPCSLVEVHWRACCFTLGDCSLGLFFDTEDWGSRLLRNISEFPWVYTASYPCTIHSHRCEITKSNINFNNRGIMKHGLLIQISSVNSVLFVCIKISLQASGRSYVTSLDWKGYYKIECVFWEWKQGNERYGKMDQETALVFLHIIPWLKRCRLFFIFLYSSSRQSQLGRDGRSEFSPWTVEILHQEER